MTVLFIALWFLCGFISAGINHAYFSRNWTIIEEAGAEKFVVCLLMGPIGMVMFFFITNFMEFGWKMPMSKLTAQEWDKYTSARDKQLFAHTRPKD